MQSIIDAPLESMPDDAAESVRVLLRLVLKYLMSAERFELHFVGIVHFIIEHGLLAKVYLIERHETLGRDIAQNCINNFKKYFYPSLQNPHSFPMKPVEFLALYFIAGTIDTSDTIKQSMVDFIATLQLHSRQTQLLQNLIFRALPTANLWSFFSAINRSYDSRLPDRFFPDLETEIMSRLLNCWYTTYPLLDSAYLGVPLPIPQQLVTRVVPSVGDATAYIYPTRPVSFARQGFFGQQPSVDLSAAAITRNFTFS